MSQNHSSSMTDWHQITKRLYFHTLSNKYKTHSYTEHVHMTHNCTCAIVSHQNIQLHLVCVNLLAGAAF